MKSIFVIEKVEYKLEGKCKQCGQCCSHIYCLDTYTEDEFNLMTKIFPKYKRFEIIGKDEYGIILKCNLLTEDGKCSVYDKRLPMCRNYPNMKRMRFGAKLFENCGYKVTHDKNFEDYLKK